MSKKHNDIDQLSTEHFKAYQEGNLSAEEMYAVEKYLLNNPFEAEALEGLETLAPETLDGHLQDLHTQLDKKLAPTTETKVVFWTMTRKLAASLIIILTASFIYLQTVNESQIGTKELTENIEKAKAIPEQEAKAPTNLTRQDSTLKPEQSDSSGSSDIEGKKDSDDKVEWKDDAQSSLVASTKAQTETKEADAIGDLSEEGSVNSDFSVRAKTEVPTSSKTEEKAINTSVASLNVDKVKVDLNSTENTKVILATDDLEKPLQGRVAGVDTRMKEAKTNFQTKNKLKQELKIKEASSNDFLISDSIKSKEAAFKKLSEAKAQVIANNATKRKAAFVSTDSLTKTITGLVTDDVGEPLKGVHVQVKGTSIGTLTDEKGAYRLNTPITEGNILFRYLGYTTQEIGMANFNVLNVELATDIITVSEVIVSDFSPPTESEDEEETSKNHIPARPIYGQKAFETHVKENLVYPEAAIAKKIKGRVLVEFTVTKEGDLTNFKILKGLGYGCDEEAIRLIKTGPRWQARKQGYDKSRPVESKVKVRIKFKP